MLVVRVDALWRCWGHLTVFRHAALFGLRGLQGRGVEPRRRRGVADRPVVRPPAGGGRGSSLVHWLANCRIVPDDDEPPLPAGAGGPVFAPALFQPQVAQWLRWNSSKEVSPVSNHNLPTCCLLVVWSQRSRAENNSLMQIC